jgi:hypothetical protein
MLTVFIVYIFVFIFISVNIVSFLKNYRKFTIGEKKWISILTGSVFCWVVCNFISDVVKVYDIAVLFASLAVLGPIIIATAMFHISDLFSRSIKIVSRDMFLLKLVDSIAIFVIISDRVRKKSKE